MVIACSSDDRTTPGVTPVPDAAPAVDPGASTDAGAAADAASPTPLPPVEGTLVAKAAGALTTTAELGDITLSGGSAQWRPRPSGGGVLTVTLIEAARTQRAFELSIFDDTGTLDPGETFPSAAPTSIATPRRARVETYGVTGAWTTGGDGSVVVVARAATSVTLELKNVGQFARAPATNDTWTLQGTVTVSIAPLTTRTGPSATMTLSDPQNEPITSEPLNLTAVATPLTGPAKLDDEPYPFTSARRAITVTDTQGRRLLIGFPSGHLARAAFDVTLNTFDRVTVTLVEGATFTGDAREKVWEADLGTVAVESRTDTSIVLAVRNARMQSESPAAKGTFALNGTVTVPLP